MKNLILVCFSGADDEHLNEKPQSFLLHTPDMSGLSEKEQNQFLESVTSPYSGWTSGICSAHWVDDIKCELEQIHFVIDRFIMNICREFGIEDTRDWWQLPGIEDDSDVVSLFIPFESKDIHASFLIEESVEFESYLNVEIVDEESMSELRLTIDEDLSIIGIESDSISLVSRVLSNYIKAVKNIKL